jgi:hypothetical protein
MFGNVEIRAVNKYLCKKGMSPKEIMKTSWLHFGRSPLSVKKWAAEFKRGRRVQAILADVYGMSKVFAI